MVTIKKKILIKLFSSILTYLNFMAITERGAEDEGRYGQYHTHLGVKGGQG